MTSAQLSALLSYIDAAIANAVATDDYKSINGKYQIESVYCQNEKQLARLAVEAAFIQSER